MSEEKGTPLPGLAGAGFGPETIKAIFDIVKNFKDTNGNSVGSMLQNLTTESLPQANNHTILPIEKIDEACEAGSFNKATLVKYILMQDKILVQNDKDLMFWTNYSGLVDYPNLFAPAYILSKPKLANEGIVFDIDEPLPEGAFIDVIAVGIEDEKLSVPEGEKPLAGCVVKLHVANGK
jgi:hypothetical protein